jgi:hypothetical protein
MQAMPIQAPPPSQMDRDEKGAPLRARAANIGAGAGAVDNVIASSQSMPFNVLRDKAKTDEVASRLLKKLVRGGGHGGAQRPIAEAELLYNRIPPHCRGGPEAALNHVKSADMSHVVPVADYKAKGLSVKESMKSSNIVFEDHALNNARGRNVMTTADRARANLVNAGPAIRSAAAAGAVVSFAVSAVSHGAAVRRGSLSEAAAGRKVLADTASGAVNGAAFVAACVLVPPLAPIATVAALSSLAFAGVQCAAPEWSGRVSTAVADRYRSVVDFVADGAEKTGLPASARGAVAVAMAAPGVQTTLSLVGAAADAAADGTCSVVDTCGLSSRVGWFSMRLHIAASTAWGGAARGFAALAGSRPLSTPGGSADAAADDGADGTSVAAPVVQVDADVAAHGQPSPRESERRASLPYRVGGPKHGLRRASAHSWSPGPPTPRQRRWQPEARRAGRTRSEPRSGASRRLGLFEA